MNIFLDGMSVTILARVLNRVTKGVMLPIVCVLVWSLSPLLISGEWLIRMYTLLGFWVACLLWVTVTSSRWRWVVWGVAGLGALYTHIIGAVIFASATVVLIGTQPRRRRWLVAFALMILALWLPFAHPTVRLFTSNKLLGASVNPTYQLVSYEVPTALLTTVLAHRMVLPNWAGWGLLASWVICWGIAWRQSRLRPLLAGSGWDSHLVYAKKWQRSLAKRIPRLARLILRWPGPAYRGRLPMGDQKVGVLARCEFALCPENCSSLNGYITEKIFNTLFAGCIPIYQGHPDSTRWLPPEMFVPMERFSNGRELAIS